MRTGRRIGKRIMALNINNRLVILPKSTIERKSEIRSLKHLAMRILSLSKQK